MSSELDFLKALSPQEEGYIYHTINAFIDLVIKYGSVEIEFLTIKEADRRFPEGPEWP